MCHKDAPTETESQKACREWWEKAQPTVKRAWGRAQNGSYLAEETRLLHKAWEAASQQPAAPSGEAVAEYVRATVTALERIGEDQAVVAGVDTSALADKGRSLLAAPQQPAGVDEAMVEGLKQLVRYLAGNPNFDFDAALADHAARQQGGRADG